jgi:hypothetical protein
VKDARGFSLHNIPFVYRTQYSINITHIYQYSHNDKWKFERGNENKEVPSEFIKLSSPKF